MKNIIIWGASGHAKVLLSVLDNNPDFCPLAFIDLNPNIQQFSNYKVFNSIEALCENIDIDNKEIYFIIAIGGERGAERLQIHFQLLALGMKPLTFIHPSAWVDPSAKIAEGAQILGMSAISADARIGIQTIINTNATIDHETVIGDGCHVMPAATIAGCVTVHNFCTIGSNATILPRITLGSYTVVGAGAVVTKNTIEYSKVVGVPAKQMT